MNGLNLPEFTPKIMEKDGKRSIFDRIRRKYVALTPEEWVRQHFVYYLIAEKNYPESCIANEVQIKLNSTVKRCDTIVYNLFVEPLAIVEYKAPQIRINRTIFDQIVRYNMELRVKYLIVSNGMDHYCCRIDYETQSYSFLEEIPNYQAMING